MNLLKLLPKNGVMKNETDVMPDGTDTLPDGTDVMPDGTDVLSDSADERRVNNNSTHNKTYILNGVTYNFVKVLSDRTGEGEVFLLEKGGVRYAAKFYKPQLKPDIRVLQQVKSLAQSGMVVPLLEYGVWHNPTTDKDQAYSLMYYVANGSLSDTDMKHKADVLKTIALKAAACLDLCHTKNIIHKDIKPGNFFYADANRTCLMLADFGISDYMDNGHFVYSRQSCTHLYSAPEVYLSYNNTAKITPKSDFYSLGIMLICLWSGIDTFRKKLAVPSGKNMEIEMAAIKQSGQLPYPQDMPADLLLLVQGLTIPDVSKRWGFEEIQRWGKGGLTANDIKVNIRTDIPFVFDEDNGLVACLPSEMADCIAKDEELAVKYLRRGKISEWLQKCQRNRMATELDDILKDKCDDDYLVVSAIYLLDPDRPFYGVEGNALSSLEELGKEVYDNKSVYSGNVPPCTFKLLYYLQHHGCEDICTEYLDAVDNTEEDAVWQLQYLLDPALPYPICYSSHTESYLSPEELLAGVAKNIDKMPQVEFDALCRKSFRLWLQYRSKETVKRIDAFNKKFKLEDNPWSVLYNIDLRCGYEMTLSNKEGECHKTIEEIARLADTMACMAFCGADSMSFTSKDADDFIACFKKFDGSRLHIYFLSKGCFSKQIDWLRYCMETKKGDNAKKYGPYNETIAIWKTIAGWMPKGSVPRYYVLEKNKYISSLADIDTLPAKDIKTHLNKNYLSYWLTLLFQENPFADLSKKYAYEILTDKYMCCLESYCADMTEVKNYRIATEAVEKSRKEVTRVCHSITAFRIIAAILFLTSFGIIAYILLTDGFPFTRNPMPGFSGPAILIMTGIFSVIAFASYDCDGCMTAVIIGAIAAFAVYYVIYLILALIMPIASIVILVLLAVALFFVTKRFFFKSSPRDLLRQMNSPETLYVEPLHFTFKASTGTSFVSQMVSKAQQFVSDLKDYRKRMWRCFIPTFLVIQVILWPVLLFIPEWSPLNSLVPEEKTIEYPITGKWTGQFDNHEATMNVVNVDEDAVTASITVIFNSYTTEHFAGNVINDKMLSLDDKNRENGILDGRFYGVLNEDYSTYEGTYENYNTKKQYKFKFVKIKTN